MVTWPSAASIPYRVQWKSAISTAGWQSITDFTGTGSTMSWTDDGSQTGIAPGDPSTHVRFYLIVVP